MIALLAVAITGCASIPDPALPALALATSTNQRLEMVGARGPLSPKRATALLAHLELEAPDADALKRHLAIEQAVAGTPLYTGNRSTILQDGYQTFPAVFAAIQDATRSLYLEYYVFDDVQWQGTRLEELLISKSLSGVEVAVLYDGVGSIGTSGDFLKSLTDAGVKIVEFNPLNPLKSHHRWSPNNRDHRKILVADNRVAIVGGVNMSTDYESGPSAGLGSHEADSSARAPYWHDTDIEISGPAVEELSKLFEDHWHEQGGPPLATMDPPPTAPAEGTEVVHVVGQPGGRVRPADYATVLSAINSAERSVWLTAAYFVPTHQEKVALARAARRGVDVRLLLPSHTDSTASLAVQRSSYGRLLKAGVKIFERDGVILHSKSMVVDGV